MFEKFPFNANFQKLSENSNFGQDFRKKILILVEISKNIDFSQIFEKFRFWSKFRKNLEFGQDFRKI